MIREIGKVLPEADRVFPDDRESGGPATLRKAPHRKLGTVRPCPLSLGASFAKAIEESLCRGIEGDEHTSRLQNPCKAAKGLQLEAELGAAVIGSGRSPAKSWSAASRWTASAAGATAAKVCGAGGGGCVFCYGPPAARPAIAEAIVAAGALVLEYRIETEGLRVG